jgi:hypothetical protein
VSNIEHPNDRERSYYFGLNLGGMLHAVLVYSFSILNADGSDREFLGLPDLLNDNAALAFAMT